jgi:hypothetical protein
MRCPAGAALARHGCGRARQLGVLAALPALVLVCRIVIVTYVHG